MRHATATAARTVTVDATYSSGGRHTRAAPPPLEQSATRTHSHAASDEGSRRRASFHRGTSLLLSQSDIPTNPFDARARARSRGGTAHGRAAPPPPHAGGHGRSTLAAAASQPPETAFRAPPFSHAQSDTALVRVLTFTFASWTPACAPPPPLHPSGAEGAATASARTGRRPTRAGARRGTSVAPPRDSFVASRVACGRGGWQ